MSWMCILGLLLVGDAKPASSATLPMAAPATTAALKYLPDEADAVASANVVQMLGSEIYRKYALDRVNDWLKQDPRARVLDVVGLDPNRDVRRVVVAGPGSLAARTRWLAVVLGRFDLGRIETSAALASSLPGDRLKIDRSLERPLYEVHGKNLRDPVFAAFIDSHTLVASPVRGWVADAILKHAGKKEASINKELRAMLEGRDDSVSLWLAAVPLDLVRNQLASNPRLRGMFAGIRGVTGEVAFTDQARAELRIDADNPRVRQELRRYLEAARAVTILAVTSNEKMQQEAPLWAGLLESFDLAQDGQTLTLRASVTARQIERWVESKRPVPADSP